MPAKETQGVSALGRLKYIGGRALNESNHVADQTKAGRPLKHTA
jgi:hypothetical protein